MASNADYFLKKTLGDDFFESLTKFELWKPGTRTTIDHEEIKTALMIVPRTVMALMIRELTPMKIGETKQFDIPSDQGAPHGVVRVTKHERDVYSGDVLQENKIVVDFKYRSIPGVGLIIMSAFELYDTSELLKEQKEAPKEDDASKLQNLIDQRLALHDLIERVVDKKIEQKDAIKELIRAKITEHMSPAHSVGQEYRISKAESNDKKESPLKGFLEKRKDKSKPSEFSIQMEKNENVHCPDCGESIFKESVFSGCICLGDDRDRKVHIKKTEDGVKIRFGRGWDAENIEMLLEVLRRNRG